MLGLFLWQPSETWSQEGGAAARSELEKLPYRQAPIDYFSPQTDDPVGRLKERLERGELTLEYHEAQGYLPALLQVLDVPVSSQMLVFAKNSVNARLISPTNPRALYFNDEVYVGWVPGAPALEISAVDPHKGGMFYTLRQQADQPPRLVREESCLLCHASANALNVPGHLLRSFLTDPQGNPTQGLSRIDHDTPFSQRWGGWFVTGDFGALPHRGNLVTAAEVSERLRAPATPGRAITLKRQFDVVKYPSAHSDIVALLVHDHQIHFHNLLTRINYEERLRSEKQPLADGEAPLKLTDSEERLVRYLLFVDEPPLEQPILGGSTFENWFPRQGPRDRQGRSLRKFNLETRLFEFRCSYLVYSRGFAALPDAVRERIYHRLWDILTSERPDPPYSRLPQAERTAIREILGETAPGLPEWWREGLGIRR
ncbi:MAG: hypothetical protein ACKV0T_02470 [Planctomycetales bacterium]